MGLASELNQHPTGQFCLASLLQTTLNKTTPIIPCLRFLCGVWKIKVVRQDDNFRSARQSIDFVALNSWNLQALGKKHVNGDVVQPETRVLRWVQSTHARARDASSICRWLCTDSPFSGLKHPNCNATWQAYIWSTAAVPDHWSLRLRCIEVLGLGPMKPSTYTGDTLVEARTRTQALTI